MAEIQGLLLAMLFMLVLVVGCILITAIGGGLVLLFLKIGKNYAEKGVRENGQNNCYSTQWRKMRQLQLPNPSIF